MFKLVRSIASKLFRGFLRAGKATGKGLKAFGEAANTVAENSTVYTVEQAERRLKERGDFVNCVGVLFGSEEVREDLRIVRDYGDYAASIKARRLQTA